MENLVETSFILHHKNISDVKSQIYIINKRYVNKEVYVSLSKITSGGGEFWGGLRLTLVPVKEKSGEGGGRVSEPDLLVTARVTLGVYKWRKYVSVGRVKGTYEFLILTSTYRVFKGPGHGDI